MQTTAARESQSQSEEERLLRLSTRRRERSVELRVHYEIRRANGCDIYRIITIDEVD